MVVSNKLDKMAGVFIFFMVPLPWYEIEKRIDAKEALLLKLMID